MKTLQEQLRSAVLAMMAGGPGSGRHKGIHADLKEYTKFKSNVSVGKAHECQTNSARVCRNLGYKTVVGVIVEKKSRGTFQGKKVEVARIPHAWNIDKEGNAVDTTLGDRGPKEYKYYGKEVPDSVGKNGVSIDKEFYTKPIRSSLTIHAEEQPMKDQKKEWPLQGHTTYQGLKICIENKKGSIRSGKEPSGKLWSIKMPFDYGYVASTKGVDGDEVDCFLGPNPRASHVFIVHQRKNNGPECSEGAAHHIYDEDKCFLGWDTADAAKKAYHSAYKNVDLFTSMTMMSIKEFKSKFDSFHGKKLHASLQAGGPGSGRHKDFGKSVAFIPPSHTDKSIKETKKQAFAHANERKALGENVKVTRRYDTITVPRFGIQSLPTYTVKSLEAGGQGSGRRKGTDNKLKEILHKEWKDQTDEERRYVALKDPSHRQNKLFDEPFTLTSGGPGSGRHPWGRKAKPASHRLFKRAAFLQKHRDASTLKKEGDARHQDYAEKKSQGLNTRGKPIISTRQKIALKNTVIVAKDQQDKAEEIERLVTKALGGVQQHNNSPMDVVMKFPNGKTMGLEVKSLLLQKNDKITMKRESLAKKVQWGKDNKSNIGTVVVDLRQKGMQVYYRDGVGSFRIMHMTEVQGGLKGLTNAIGGK